MFENYTQDYFNDLLVEKAAENGYSAVEGSLVYNIIAPMSAMLEDCFDTLRDAWDNVWADTCDREQLIRFAQMRGLSPQPQVATRITISSTGELEEGAIFSNGDLTFEVEDKVTDDETDFTYYAECEQEGTEGNAITVGETLTWVDDEDVSATVTTIEEYGVDEEDTEAFRERYFSSFGVGGQFGNREYYLQQALNVEGVANASVSWNSSTSTVTINVLPEDMSGDADALKEKVEEAVQVSYGHQLSVAIISAYTDIKVEITNAVLADSYTTDMVKADIFAAVNDYFDECNRTINDDGNYKVYVAKLTAKIMSLDSIIDAAIKVENSSGTEYTGTITSTTPFYMSEDNISISEAT